MAAKRKVAKRKAAAAGSTVASARANPYVSRFIEDEDLRDNVREALEAARDAYARLSNGKAPAKTVLDDKKFHKDLQRSAAALAEARDSLHGRRRKKRGGMGLGKLLLVTVVGGAVALAVSEDLRNKVLDLLFGAEEEFDYTSTTSPAGAPPAAPVT